MEIKFERDCREFQFVKFVRKKIYCAIIKIVHRKINLCYNSKKGVEVLAQEKDITEKRLESYADVFADIVNVLLFDGVRLIQPQDLLDSLPHSVYKGTDKKIHDEERDIAKFWKQGNIDIAFVGLENQTD